MTHLEEFERYRPLLFAIAYRMLSSVVDAEDMVQETYLRWQQVEREMVRSAKSYLSSIIARLCIDRLRSARIRRETYIGPWLPEPLLTQQSSNPLECIELAESLSFAFLKLLECLSPTERAIFLLREVFEYDYAEIAAIVHKSIPNCRQIFHRAREHLNLHQQKSNLSLQQKEELTEKFLISWHQGDVQGLVALMAEDVTIWSDGGGKVVAAQKPLHGNLKVALFLRAIRRSKRSPTSIGQIALINGQPAILNLVGDRLQSIFCFEFVDGHIRSIFAVVNPDKLRAIQLSF